MSPNKPSIEQLKQNMIRYGLNPQSRADMGAFMQHFEETGDPQVAIERAATEKQQREKAGDPGASTMQTLSAFFDNLQKSTAPESQQPGEKQGERSGLDLLDAYFSETLKGA